MLKQYVYNNQHLCTISNNERYGHSMWQMLSFSKTKSAKPIFSLLSFFTWAVRLFFFFLFSAQQWKPLFEFRMYCIHLRCFRFVQFWKANGQYNAPPFGRKWNMIIRKKSSVLISPEKCREVSFENYYEGRSKQLGGFHKLFLHC